MSESDEPMLKTGTIFAGRYRIIRLLGQGDRKRTYLAQDSMLPRPVAVAMIRSAAADTDPEGTRREAHALAKAGTHDNVVTFHDWGIVEGTEYLVFDYLPGGTLRELLTKRAERGKLLPAEDVMRLGRQLARALSHVHKLGFIHRDVAPGNVWLDERQVAHLGDFDSAVSRDDALDPAGLPPTTEAYAAPEQIAGAPFDERSDLYSLGAVLFEALTGQRPSRAPRPAIARYLKAARPDIPRTLVETVSSLLAERPEERPVTAGAVLEALEVARVYRSADEGLLAWAETLPFPLASILRHYEGEPEPALKVDYLLKFFEALAQFTATVLVSGCVADDRLVQEHRRKWLASSERDSHGLHRATFGTWVTLSERVAETVGALLKDDSNRCLELFAATDTDLVSLLAGADLAGILRHALDRRNNWSGHGGVAGERIRRERLSDLQNLLEKTRAVLDWAFEPWTLLKPGQMLLKGDVFDVTATILKGTNPAFLRKQVQVTKALDASRLYLLANGSTTALQLVPFIRVQTSASGQDACYFYSRLENNTVRWVSYHFQTEPDLVSSDDELTGLLARLAPPDATTRQATGTRPTPQRAPISVHKGRPQPNSGRPLYEHCQRCGYPFGRLTTQQFCGVRAACDRRLQEPGYRVPDGREQNLKIWEATITAHPELGPRPR